MKLPCTRLALPLKRWVAPVLCLCLPAVAVAQRGLTPEAGEWLWPQLQARITLQTTALALGSQAVGGGLNRVADASGTPGRHLRGGAIFGDYVFASPGFGNFRATSGVLLGAQGGAPVGQGIGVSKLSVSMLEGPAVPPETQSTVPYMGLGYSTPALWRSFFLSADLGVVAARPAGFSSLGRAMLGNQPMDAAVRDLRLAPMMQFGMRYSF